MPNELTVISRSELSELRDLFRQDWPHHISGYYTVENFIRWHEKRPETEFVFYSLNDNWRQSGAFVLFERRYLYMHALDKGLDELRKLLIQVEWSPFRMICACLKRFRGIIDEVCIVKNLKLEIETGTSLYYLPKGVARGIQFEIPKGVSIKPLSTREHIETVNAVYPYRICYRDEQSIDHFMLLKELNPHLGVFNEQEELMAWCFVSTNRGLHALHTLDKYRRKGLAILINKAMIKKLAEMDTDSMANVVFGNEASEKLYEKLGFSKINEASWIRLSTQE